MARENYVHKTAETDWRRRPRKPRGIVRTERLAIRVSLAELAAIRRGASEAGQTLTDFIVGRCASKKRRSADTD